MLNKKEIKYAWHMIKSYSWPAFTPTQINEEVKKDPEFWFKYKKINTSRDELGNLASVIFQAHFGWSVPNEAAIHNIIEFANEEPILEIGSGMGLWAYLLQLYGLKVYPTDNFSHGIQFWGYPFTKIEYLNNIEALKFYKDINILMLIWPEIGSMAYETLIKFKGNKLIFIGELMELSANANYDFYEEIMNNWAIKKEIEIPRFFSNYDSAFLLNRHK